MTLSHWYMSMFACILLWACSSPNNHKLSVPGEANLEASEVQSPEPKIIINLDEKEGCSEKGVKPGDVVSWTSSRISRIKDKQKVVVIFDDNRHPFEEEPKLENNKVVDVVPQLYRYRVFEGDTELGCGTIRNPCGPPNGPCSSPGDSGSPGYF